MSKTLFLFFDLQFQKWLYLIWLKGLVSVRDEQQSFKSQFIRIIMKDDQESTLNITKDRV